MKSFSRWVLAQKDRDDHIGDFAREMAAEAWFRAEPRSIMQVKLWLLGIGAQLSALEAFADAVLDYIDSA